MELFGYLLGLAGRVWGLYAVKQLIAAFRNDNGRGAFLPEAAANDKLRRAQAEAEAGIRSRVHGIVLKGEIPPEAETSTVLEMISNAHCRPIPKP